MKIWRERISKHFTLCTEVNEKVSKDNSLSLVRFSSGRVSALDSSAYTSLCEICHVSKCGGTCKTPCEQRSAHNIGAF